MPDEDLRLAVRIIRDENEMRQCGSCAMCCKVLPIETDPELNKPAGKWCKHWSKAGGCGIYEERHEVCRTFFCLWKMAPYLGEELKPDRSRVVLAMYKEQVLIAYVDPAFPNAWKEGAMGRFLQSYPERVLIQTGDTKKALVPAAPGLRFDPHSGN